MIAGDRTWFILREPRCVPQMKGPVAPGYVKAFLRELMVHRPTAFITVLTISGGRPDVQDGPECLMMLDGRMRSTALRHIESCRQGHAARP